MTGATATREDTLAFGLRAVGWQARRSVGDATRPVESLEDLLADRSAFEEDLNADAAGEQGHGHVRLSQLAVESLLGAR